MRFENIAEAKRAVINLIDIINSGADDPVFRGFNLVETGNAVFYEVTEIKGRCYPASSKLENNPLAVEDTFHINGNKEALDYLIHLRRGFKNREERIEFREKVKEIGGDDYLIREGKKFNKNFGERIIPFYHAKTYAGRINVFVVDDYFVVQTDVEGISTRHWIKDGDLKAVQERCNQTYDIIYNNIEGFK